MRVAIARQALPTFYTGSWDFTASGYGTCIGAVFKVSGGLADITVTNTARLAHGFTDGTNDRCVSWSSAHNSLNTSTRRYKDATHCVVLINGNGAVNGSASFSSFITDGIRLNIDAAFNNAFFVEATLYFDDGTDEVFVGTGDTSAGDDTVAVGFEFAFMEGVSTRQSSVGSSDLGAKFSLGYTINDASPPTQHSLSFYEEHSVADGAPSTRVDSAYFLRDIENSSVLGAVEIDDVDSSGFTAYQINSAGFEFYFIAVKCDNVVSLDLARSLDATGVEQHTEPGFHPAAVFGWNTKINTLNSNFENARAGAFGRWQATGPGTQFNSSVALADASPTTDTQSVNDDSFPYLPDHDGGTTTAIIGTITAFKASGIEVDYTTVDSVRCYFAILAIGILPITVTPTPGVATFAAVRPPDVILGSTVATPTAGSATFLGGTDPSVVYGSTTATPTAGSASFLGVNPTVILGSTTATPPVGSIQFLASDPTVDAGVPVVLATVTAYETRVGFNYLHGNVPCPDNWTETRLFLRDPNGVPVPTEQYVVERGPAGNTRVLELRGRCEGPGGVQQYSVEEGTVLAPVEWGFHNNITINIQCDAPNSFTDQSIVQFSSQLLRGEPSTGAAGDITRTIRRFGQLQSSSGSPLFGYEAFVTTVAGEPDVWLFEMVVQNGNVGTPGSPLGANALHDVFFNEIRLDLSADYDVLHLIPTPYTSVQGAPVKKLMTPNGDGSQHCIEIGGSHEYRFVVYHTSKFARASVLLNMFGFFVTDFSKTRWSWNNRQTAWFGPRGSFVAQATLTNYLPYGVSWAGTGGLAAALLGGNPINLDNGGWNSTPMGPFHARGATDPGPPSGVGILGHVGHEIVNGGSVNKLKTLMAIQSMDRDRQSGKQGDGSNPPAHLAGISLVGNDQKPIDPAQWNLSNCSTNTPGKFSVPGPFNRAAASTWRYDKALADGKLPFYYGQKMGFAPHSYSHYIRGLSATFPLIWLRNDPLAKSYARQLAAWSRIRYLEYGLGELWTSWSGFQGVDELPGKGCGGFGDGGRSSGWSMVAMAVDYQIGDDTKRTNYVNWYELLVPHHEQSQFPYPGSGNWSAVHGTPATVLENQWNANGHGGLGVPNAAGSQAIEIGIHGYGLASLEKALGNASLRSMLSTACRGMRDYHWLPGFSAPCQVSPVRSKDKTLAAWTQQYTTGDPFGVPGGMAPDCFTKQNEDNYQITSLILAALKADPSHTQAWSAIFTALGASTIEEAISDLFAMITSDKLKWTSGWNAVLGYLQDVEENTYVLPAPGSVTFRGVNPDLFFNSTTASPAAGTATFLGVNPTVNNGPRVAVPDPAIATFLGVDPAVLVSGVTVTPTAASAAFLGVSPAVVQASMVVAPAAGTATFLGVDPNVISGSRTSLPDPGVVEFLAVDPAVELGSTTSAPDAAAATFAAVDPTVVFNSFAMTPEAGVVTFLAEDPAPDPALSVTPPAGVATFRAGDPAVIDSDTALVSSTVTLMGSISTVLATLRGRV